MNYLELSNKIAGIEPGQWFTVDRHELERIAPAMSLLGSLGPTWSPAERIMENIVGSAYNFRFWEDPATARITFEHLKHPLRDGLRSYVSPDRAGLFTRTPDGFYRPNT
ncbi:hypothetical protein OPIT5_29375 [Opitutaceae bacterium TAV5]|nr:hypothetical protein OPIT5_21745 [Opitutaceae bacterium TAV5]AHF94891.1 hypothetical protein OPIT5_29375 [Opitutaceae bacterium TAV5]